MTNIDSRESVMTIDRGGALLSIEQLPQQCEQAWNEAQKIELPANYADVAQVVVCGMGASWLGAHIMQGLLADQLKVPLLVVHDYQLPAYVSDKTLVITSSYSGTTEETIEALEQAHMRGAKVITISTGGRLATFAQENKLPHYTFTGTHNPANSPRLGLGYSIVAQMVMLTKLGIISYTQDEMYQAIAQLKLRVAELTVETADNEAKKMAQALVGKIPVVVAGTFLFGNAHAFANQFNETSKTFGTFMHIPELNHHLMEGLAHPDEAKKLTFIFLESNRYEQRVQRRFLVTKEVVEQNKIEHLTYTPQGNTKIVQAFDTLLFGSFVTYYLAMLYGVDPAPNPWVDYFKKRLKELAS